MKAASQAREAIDVLYIALQANILRNGVNHHSQFWICYATGLLLLLINYSVTRFLGMSEQLRLEQLKTEAAVTYASSYHGKSYREPWGREE